MRNTIRGIASVAAVLTCTLSIFVSVEAQDARNVIRQSGNPGGRISDSNPSNAPSNGQPNSNQQANPNQQPIAAQNQGQNPLVPEGMVPAQAQAPFPPLSAELEKFLDSVLAAWQKSTNNIERYECSFTRWQYDITRISDPKVYYSHATGVVRYAAPDKGMFRVDDLKFVSKGRDGNWALESLPNQFGEWWICDGQSIHIYDRTEKVAKKYSLPKEMRGKEVFNSPLPFLFGVDAQKIKTRYWINPLPPETTADGKRYFRLEAYPKFQADVANYHHVEVLLDEAEFLPHAITVYAVDWRPDNPNKEIYEFRDRKRNMSFLDQLKAKAFSDEFIPKQPPKDWRVEEQPFIPDEDEEDGRRVASPAGGGPNVR